MSDATDGPDDDDLLDEEELTCEAVCEYLAKAVVEEPAAVDLEIEDDDDDSVALIVHVADDDMGRVIGKRGRTANAIRTVVRAAAEHDGVRVDVEFAD